MYNDMRRIELVIATIFHEIRITLDGAAVFSDIKSHFRSVSRYFSS